MLHYLVAGLGDFCFKLVVSATPAPPLANDAEVSIIYDDLTRPAVEADIRSLNNHLLLGQINKLLLGSIDPL